MPSVEAHAQCVSAGVHICQEPSGRRCYSQPCDEPAGTWWGPYWCPIHDKERLDGISDSLESMAGNLERRGTR